MEYITSAPSAHHQNITRKCITSTSPMHYQYITSTSPVYNHQQCAVECITSTLYQQRCTSAVHRQHIARQSLANSAFVCIAFLRFAGGLLRAFRGSL